MKQLNRYHDEYKEDKLTEYFEKIKDNIDFNIWFFGHHHENQKIENKFICLYEQIVQLC